MKDQFIRHINEKELSISFEQKELLSHFFSVLYESNQSTNLTGYKEPVDYVQYHLIDTMEMCRLFDFNQITSLIDIGTGCGVPGIIIKIFYPHIRLSLLETTRKKTDFLENAVVILDLDKVTVINDRAEFLGQVEDYREKYDAVIARALASFPVSLELTAGFAKEGGYILLPRGETYLGNHIQHVCELLSLTPKNAPKYNLIGRNEPFYLNLFLKNAKLAEKYPRKPGNIKKRPL